MIPSESREAYPWEIRELIQHQLEEYEALHKEYAKVVAERNIALALLGKIMCLPFDDSEAFQRGIQEVIETIKTYINETTLY